MSTPPITAVDAVRNTGLSEWDNGESWLPTDHQTLQVYGRRGADVIGDTLDLPISKAGGYCHNQVTDTADNIVNELRIGYPTSYYDGKVQALVQMGWNAE